MTRNSGFGAVRASWPSPECSLREIPRESDRFAILPFGLGISPNRSCLLDRTKARSSPLRAPFPTTTTPFSSVSKLEGLSAPRGRCKRSPIMVLTTRLSSRRCMLTTPTTNAFAPRASHIVIPICTLSQYLSVVTSCVISCNMACRSHSTCCSACQEAPTGGGDGSVEGPGSVYRTSPGPGVSPPVGRSDDWTVVGSSAG